MLLICVSAVAAHILPIEIDPSSGWITGLLRALEIVVQREANDAASSKALFAAKSALLHAGDGPDSPQRTRAGKLFVEAKRLHRQHDYSGSCALANLACRLLGAHREQEEAVTHLPDIRAEEDVRA